MSELSRTTLAKRIGAFEPHYAQQFLIDNVKLTFSPASDVTRAKIWGAPHALAPSALTNAAQLGLRSSASLAVRPGPGGFALCWKGESCAFRQGLRGGRFSDRTLICDFNPIRIVRKARSIAEQRQHDPIPDNYLDPRVVPREVVHHECMHVFEAAVRERSADYCAIVERLWGVALKPSEVLVSVNVIELAWDAVVPGHASLLSTLFWDGWKRSFTEPRQAFEVPRLEFSAAGMLKALGKNDEILKLYGKTVDQVRFEAQLTKDTAKNIIGRRFNPGCPSEFRSALVDVADAVFPTILAVQAASITPEVPNLFDVARAVGASPAMSYVLDRLIHFGIVKTRGQADYKILRRLRARGIVNIGPERGFWSLTDEGAASFGALHRHYVNEARWRA